MTRPLPNLQRDWAQAPKLYDEVEWGPYPSSQDYLTAYNAWKRPYDTLRPDLPLERPEEGSGAETDWLEERLESPLDEGYRQDEYAPSSALGNRCCRLRREHNQRQAGCS